MSCGVIFRRALCVSLRNKRNRSASCHARIMSNASHSRSIEPTVCIESKLYNFNSVHCYSTEIKRHWHRMNDAMHPSDPTFTLMSYNILAQHLINTQPSLYMKHDPNALHWTHRFNAIKREIANISPDILCLQEVQQNHLTEIATHFDDLGYDTTLFKKRTGLHIDGCAIFFKKQLFDLIEFHFVDYFQPNINVSTNYLGAHFCLVLTKIQRNLMFLPDFKSIQCCNHRQAGLEVKTNEKLCGIHNTSSI